jgi:hypothetical protein
MFDRDVSRSLFKIAHGIAAGCHQVAEQLIGLGYSARRCIHKVSLHTIPLLGVPRPIFSDQRTKVKLLYALGALFKPRFGAAAIATLGYSAVILGPEVLTKFLRAPPLQIEHDDGANHDNNYGNNDRDLGGRKILHVHDPVLLLLCV